MYFDSINEADMKKTKLSSDLSRSMQSARIENRISLMEKVNRGTYFPPLAIPEAYKRCRIGTALSKEGQTVKNELENKKDMSQFLRQNAGKEIESIGKGLTHVDRNVGEFCLACKQRLPLQFSARPLSRDQKNYEGFSKETIRGCICILCNTALPLSPKAAGHHKIIIKSNNTARKEGNKANVLMGKRRGDANREFQITSLGYDSRFEDMQHRLEVEKSMPSKEVMKRSERKCQLWLLRNEEHIKTRTGPRYIFD